MLPLSRLLMLCLLFLPALATARPPAYPDDQLVRASLVSLVPGPGGMIVAMVMRPEGGDDLVAIYIGPIEADAIQRVRMGIRPERPLTHELMASLLETTGARIERLVIDEARNGAYLATLQLKLRDRNTPVWVDTRPSDGMSLALREEVPVYLSRQVIEAAQQDVHADPDAVLTAR